MATSTDAARLRVLAARGELQEQLHLLEASGRAAVDIPARIKRSPAKAAAIAGGAGLEYNQLEGELSGVNIYAELLAMTNMTKLSFIPTGSVGLIYFY